jgi:hypothetical protein
VEDIKKATDGKLSLVVEFVFVLRQYLRLTNDMQCHLRKPLD